MLYSLIIFICTLISVFLGIYVGVPCNLIVEGEIFVLIFWSLLSLVLIDMLCALFVRYCLPKKCFNPFLKIYNTGKWERRFYERIGVRKWKDKIPEAGKYFASFNKSEVVDMSNNKYVFKFMEETAYAEVMHVLSAIFTFLIIFLNLKASLVIALPLIVGNLILNVLPIITQRYNRPKLMMLYKRNERNKNLETAKND